MPSDSTFGPSGVHMPMSKARRFMVQPAYGTGRSIADPNASGLLRVTCCGEQVMRRLGTRTQSGRAHSIKAVERRKQPPASVEAPSNRWDRCTGCVVAPLLKHHRQPSARTATSGAGPAVVVEARRHSEQKITHTHTHTQTPVQQTRTRRGAEQQVAWTTRGPGYCTLRRLMHRVRPCQGATPARPCHNTHTLARHERMIMAVSSVAPRRGESSSIWAVPPITS
jgi:hypothetical protein